jgi:hypothetical protein
MFVGCDERLISLGVGKISKLKWGKRGACKSSVDGRRKESLSLFSFPFVSMNSDTKIAQTNCSDGIELR